MPALDTLAGLRTTGGGGADSAYTAVTLAPGDSATIKNFNPPDFAEIIGATASAGAAPLGFRVRSPYLHDISEGLQIVPGQAAGGRYLPRYARQRLRSQDTLTFEIKGSGTSDDNVAVFFIYYSNLVGLSPRLHSLADIQNLITFVKGLQVTAGTGGAAGQWLSTLVNATENLLRANTDYAVLGYVVDSPRTAVAIRGLDTGNLRCGGPGLTDPNITTDWFVRMAAETGYATIPVINSANIGSTNLDVISDEPPDSVNVTFMLAQLGQNLSN